MKERQKNLPPVPNLEYFQIIVTGVKENLIKGNCPEHGENVYFERVEGDLFQCANYTHRKSGGNSTEGDVFPGRSLIRN